ncbi:MAG TPA: hypothetical protein VM266_16650 [Solirubrobacteraceae bacterium]|nr:hypothetical protein [Solirubrobacteraceae bacterium]
MREGIRIDRRPGGPPQRAVAAPHPVHRLHGQIGNRAVARLVQRTLASGGGWGPTEYEEPGGNPDVKAWQRKLNQELDGLPELLVVDGQEGAKTRTATRLWQWSKGRPITGIRPPTPKPVETHGGGV